MQIGEWLGFLIDTISKQFRGPEKKFSKLKGLLDIVIQDGVLFNIARTSKDRRLRYLDSSGNRSYFPPIYQANAFSYRVQISIGRDHTLPFTESFNRDEILVPKHRFLQRLLHRASTRRLHSNIYRCKRCSLFFFFCFPRRCHS